MEINEVVDTSTLTFCAASDLIDLGFSEDGSTIFGESYYVVAEDAVGHRWTIGIGNDTVEDWEDEEVGYIGWGLSVDHEAKEASEKLADYLNGLPRPRLNPDKWYPSQPGYGSVAYQTEGGERGLMDDEELARCPF